MKKYRSKQEKVEALLCSMPSIPARVIAQEANCSIRLVYGVIARLGVERSAKRDINWDLPNGALAVIWQSSAIAALRNQRGHKPRWKARDTSPEFNEAIAQEKTKAKKRQGK